MAMMSRLSPCDTFLKVVCMRIIAALQFPSLHLFIWIALLFMLRCSLGDRVPADIRIIDSKELKVEASSLTGESDAIAVTCEPQHELPMEARNLVFNSSLVMNGEVRSLPCFAVAFTR